MKQRKTLVILESSALKRSCQCMCAKDTGDVVAVGVGAMLPDYTCCGRGYRRSIILKKMHNISVYITST